jgi:hypothetical protein
MLPKPKSIFMGWGMAMPSCIKIVFIEFENYVYAII